MSQKSNKLMAEIVAELKNIRAAIEELKGTPGVKPVVVILSNEQLRQLTGTGNNANTTKQKPSARSRRHGVG